MYYLADAAKAHDAVECLCVILFNVTATHPFSDNKYCDDWHNHTASTTIYVNHRHTIKDLCLPKKQWYYITALSSFEPL